MSKQTDSSDIQKLLDIMARLREPGRGCPWDLEQTFATIAPYTIEEAYEVADAIERDALDELGGELGDLLFQVVFHARMAEEGGAFDFGDVVAGICEKLERRHPHVFGDAAGAGGSVPGAAGGSGPGAAGGSGPGAAGRSGPSAAGVRASVSGTAGRRLGVAEQSRLWEHIKREERTALRTARGARAGAAGGAGSAGASEVLADVPVGLPGLSRAAKLGKRAATVGFDWPDVAGVRDKLREEIAELDAELDAALAEGAPAGDGGAGGERSGAVEHSAVGAELGDLLFTIANLCRHLDLDPEACVRGANTRFEKRFTYVEGRVRAAGGDWSAHDAGELDRFWRDAKVATS